VVKDGQLTERLIELQLGNVFPPATREGAKVAVVHRLGELQALRGAGLTEEEWRGWRGTILNDLVSYPHSARIMFIGSLACAYIPAGALIAAIVYGKWDLAVAGVGTLLLWGLIACCQARAFAAARGLTAEDRHAVVDALAAVSLVSPDEAAELHPRVGGWPNGLAEPPVAPERAGHHGNSRRDGIAGPPRR
jgi:hypothetical protein